MQQFLHPFGYFEAHFEFLKYLFSVFPTSLHWGLQLFRVDPKADKLKWKAISNFYLGFFNNQILHRLNRGSKD